MEGITSPPNAQNTSNITTSSIFSPLLISMLGIIVTSLALIIYHFFLVKYCIRRYQTTGAVTAQPAIPATSPATTGVDKNVLDNIPIFVFSVLKTGEFEVDQEECVVCLGELEDDDMVRLLPNCKHAFHVPCIDQWFAAHTSCPLCRSPPILVQLVKNDEFSILVTGASVNSSPRENMVSDSNNCDEISSPRVPSSGLLRHCSSLNLPAVEKKSAFGLKRSLSMDQSFVVINLQKEKEVINCSSTSSSSSSSSGSSKLRRSESYRTRSLSHFDRVSSKLLSSFSRLRVGKGNVDPILPY